MEHGGHPPSPLALHDLGGSGPVLLVLHANGIASACYTQLAQHLQPHFRVMALDAPGQGASPLPAGWAPTAHGAAAAVADAIAAYGLRGCWALGHSMGASLALLAEALRPGSFSAVYAYEPVLVPALPGARAAGPLLLFEGEPPPAEVRSQREAGRVLASTARRRQARFASAADAGARLGSKPPFRLLPRQVLSAYLAAGLRPETASETAAAGAAADEGGSSRGSGAAPVTLVTPPELEAQYFESMSAGVAVAPGRVRCPVMVSVGSAHEGVHSALPALGRAVGMQLPAGRVHAFSKLQHFGPLEAPAAVAAHAAAFFAAVMQGRLEAASGGDSLAVTPRL